MPGMQSQGHSAGQRPPTEICRLGLEVPKDSIETDDQRNAVTSLHRPAGIITKITARTIRPMVALRVTGPTDSTGTILYMFRLRGDPRLELTRLAHSHKRRSPIRIHIRFWAKISGRKETVKIATLLAAIAVFGAISCSTACGPTKMDGRKQWVGYNYSNDSFLQRTSPWRESYNVGQVIERDALRYEYWGARD
ncbi:hypothetical protein CGLO_02807 [Colletotrichum gloeosporioides Cg-14]|uniref:Uncharacterized protein n=1 Tax=Colletotrichum gloeosporioides (strain Cg-14) TaxID=1237896 RepID=T0M816_COLGC|nr:hypothetical protein CGLO_02807 [Colletotrichum gloeosporioides Cg-14]